MKKLISILIIGVFIFCMSGCEHRTDHNHKFGNWSDPVEANTLVAGQFLQKRACTICNLCQTRFTN